MRKVRIFEHVSLDGVVEHDENYTYGEWTAPYRSAEGAAMVMEAYSQNFDLLLGRKTYDAWAGYWPTAGDFPIAKAIKAATKYVVTGRQDGLSWGPVERIGNDAPAEIRALKLTDGPDLIVSGSTSLISVLLSEGLADELSLIVYPVLLGRGKRLFAESCDARQFSFISSRATISGVLLNTYGYVGTLVK